MNATATIRRWLAIGPVSVLLVALGAVIGAGNNSIVNAHGGDTSKFHACVDRTTGALRLVGADSDCSSLPPKWRNPIHWDKESGWLGAGSGSLSAASLVDKVGIGTNDPKDVLHLYRDTNSTVGILMGNGHAGPDRRGFLVDYHHSNGAELWNFENTDMWFGTDGQRRMTIEADGDVGIGLANPRAKLQVAGDTWLLADKNVDGTPAPGYYVSKKRYHVEMTKDPVDPTSARLIPLDMSILDELCRDEDGCTVTMGERNYDSVNRPGAVTVQGPYKLFLSQSSDWYNISGPGDNSEDGDGYTRFLVGGGDCDFTDADFTTGNSPTDDRVGLALLVRDLWWHDPNLVCILDFDD